MAKGFETNRRRSEELNKLGRELVRRSGSKCELCRTAGGRLNITEVKQSSAEPDPENCVFICDLCYSALSSPLKHSEHWRCLAGSVWSDVRPVKIISAKVLKILSDKNSWAADILEDVYLDNEELEIIGE